MGYYDKMSEMFVDHVFLDENTFRNTVYLLN